MFNKKEWSKKYRKKIKCKDFGLYQKYWHIKERCNTKKSKNYLHYGKKGIKFEWKNYKEFKQDMYENYILHLKKYGRKNTSIDRIDVKGNYSKKNCRWATFIQQANNKNNNRYITINNEVKTLTQWCRELKISYNTIKSRIRIGWDEKDLLKPTRSYGKKNITTK